MAKSKKKRKNKKKWPTWVRVLAATLALAISIDVIGKACMYSYAYESVVEAAKKSHKQMGFIDYAKATGGMLVNGWKLGATSLSLLPAGGAVYLLNKDYHKKVNQSLKSSARGVTKNWNKITGQISNNNNYKSTVVKEANSAVNNLSASQRKKFNREWAKENGGKFYGVQSEGDALRVQKAMKKALGSQSSATQKLNKKLIAAKRKQEVNNKGEETTSDNDTLVAHSEAYSLIWDDYSKLSAKKKAAVEKAMRKMGYKGSLKKMILDSQKSMDSKGNKKVAKFYKDLYKASERYLTKKQKKAIQAKLAEAADTDEARAAAKADEPESFSGKIGKALINAFWSSAIGKWMKKNSAGASIFAGQTKADKVGPTLDANPMQSIYGNQTYTTMGQVVQELMPAALLCAFAMLIVFVIINATRMGVGTITDPVRSRLQWYHSMIDLAISMIGLACYAALVNTIVQTNNGIIVAFANFLGGLTPEGASKSAFDSAVTLGFDSNVATALTKGSVLGSGFAGVFFCIIYLCSYIGLSVFIKYYYFVRAITFTILISVGPIFIAYWSFDWAKRRSATWLRELTGTVFIQCIHALTLTFMSLFMSWNNSRFMTAVGQKNHVSAFNGMVVGFIVMILFQPLSKSLAELFGISSNMLDNLHQSTSKVLKASAAVAGGALLGGAGLALGAIGGVGGAGLAALKAGKAASAAGALSKAGGALKAGAGAFRGSMKANHVLGKTMSGVRSIVGSTMGRMAGLAAGAGASSSPMTALALAQAGGEVGERAATLTSRKLSELGLAATKGRKMMKQAGAQSRDMRSKASEAVNDKVNGALAKDESAKLQEDKNSGSPAAAAQFKDSLKESQKKLEGDPQNKELQRSVKRNKDLIEANKATQDMYEDSEKLQAIAQAHANTKSGDRFNKAGDLRRAVNDTLSDNDKKKLNAHVASGQADEVTKSAALAGAVTDAPIKMQKVADADVADARQKAKTMYQMTYGGVPDKGVSKSEAEAMNSMTAKQALINGYANKDGSANTAAWLASAQYNQGLQHAMNKAGLEAAKKSDGAVLSMAAPNDEHGFDSSYADSDKFKRNITQKMQAAGLDQASIDRVGGAIDAVKATSGQNLVNTVTVPGSGTPVKVVNKELYDAMANQSAKMLNAQARPDAASGQKFTAADFEAMNDRAYNPSSVMGTNDDFSVKDFEGYLNRNDNFGDIASRNFKAEALASDAFVRTASDQAAMMSNPIAMFKAPRGADNVFSKEFDPRSLNPQIARSISNYDFQNPVSDTLGIGSEISRMQASAASNGLGGIPDDSFQMVTTNNGSFVRAKDPDYGWVQVGKFGPGDIALEGGESIIQDLAYNSDTNTIGPKMENHHIAEPYSISDGIKVPRSYSNGRPDLGTMLKNYGSNGPVSQTDMSDYTKMDTSERAAKLMDEGMLSVDKLTAGPNGYDSFKYYSDGINQTIIGHRKDAPAGNYENLVPGYREGSLLPSAMTGVQYSIDLTPTGNGFSVDDAGDVKIYSQNGQLSDQQRNSYLERIHTALEGTRSKRDFDQQLSSIIPQTDEVLANRLALHSPNKDASNLSLTNKVFDD